MFHKENKGVIPDIESKAAKVALAAGGVWKLGEEQGLVNTEEHGKAAYSTCHSSSRSLGISAKNREGRWSISPYPALRRSRGYVK